MRHATRQNTSTEWKPRSTKSPMKTYRTSGGKPPAERLQSPGVSTDTADETCAIWRFFSPTRKSSSKSKNCPWMSPATVTGLQTGTQFSSLLYEPHNSTDHRSLTETTADSKRRESTGDLRKSKRRRSAAAATNQDLHEETAKAFYFLSLQGTALKQLRYPVVKILQRSSGKRVIAPVCAPHSKPRPRLR